MEQFLDRTFASVILSSLSPVNQLFAGLASIAIFFLLLVIYLDNSENFALKRDWRKKK